MKNEYNEIDKLITDALTAEEAAYYRELSEQRLDQQVLGLFKGRMAWLNGMITVIMVIAFVLSVYAAVQFFNAQDTLLAIKWGAGFFIGMMVTTVLKLFAWNQMDKNALVREIKRLELQVANLGKIINEK